MPAPRPRERYAIISIGGLGRADGNRSSNKNGPSPQLLEKEMVGSLNYEKYEFFQSPGQRGSSWRKAVDAKGIEYHQRDRAVVPLLLS